MNPIHGQVFVSSATVMSQDFFSLAEDRTSPAFVLGPAIAANSAGRLPRASLAGLGRNLRHKQTDSLQEQSYVVGSVDVVVAMSRTVSQVKPSCKRPSVRVCDCNDMPIAEMPQMPFKRGTNENGRSILVPFAE